MKRMGIATLCVAACLSLFAGCGSGGSTSPAPPQGGPTEGATATEGAQPGGGLQGEVRYIRLEDHHRDAALDAVRAENPQLEIVEEIVPFANMDSKINMAHASGQDYDLIQVNNSSVKQFHAAGVLEPLDEYLAQAGIDLDANYSQSLLDVGRVEGTTYAISYAPDCRILAYNKKILEQAGIDPPKSQDDILKIAETLAKDGLYIFARRMDTPLAPAYIEGCFFMGNGAYICQEIDGKVVATTNTPEMIKSVEWWQKMVPYMPKDPNMSNDQEAQMFAQGKTIFYIFGPWDIKEAVGQSMEYGVDYELMPTPGLVKNASTAGGWFMGIGAGGKNKPAAWRILEKSLEPEMLVQVTNALPPDKRCFALSPFDQPIYQPFMEGLQTAEPPMPTVPQFNKVNDIFFEYFNKALIGGEDAAATMEACNQAIQKALDE